MPISNINDELEEIRFRLESIIALGDLLSSLCDPALRSETLTGVAFILTWIVEDVLSRIGKIQDCLLHEGEEV